MAVPDTMAALRSGAHPLPGRQDLAAGVAAGAKPDDDMSAEARRLAMAQPVELGGSARYSVSASSHQDRGGGGCSGRCPATLCHFTARSAGAVVLPGRGDGGRGIAAGPATVAPSGSSRPAGNRAARASAKGGCGHHGVTGRSVVGGRR